MHLVKEGVLWRVGDGRKIKLLTDNWIQECKPGSFKILSPVGVTVDLLIDEDLRSWDAALVHSIFEEDVANRVPGATNTDQSARRGGFSFLWPLTHFGDYTVSSAYNLARKENFFIDRSGKGGGTNSVIEADCIFWRKLWSIKAPGKMKINLWRFAHNCLLWAGVSKCAEDTFRPPPALLWPGGTIEHIFLFCQFAHEVWQEIKKTYGIQLCRKSFTSPKTWLHDFMLRTSDKDRRILAVIIWHLWISRNGSRNGEESSLRCCPSYSIYRDD
jgi:hypothetical protein